MAFLRSKASAPGDNNFLASSSVRGKSLTAAVILATKSGGDLRPSNRQIIWERSLTPSRFKSLMNCSLNFPGGTFATDLNWVVLFFLPQCLLERLLFRLSKFHYLLLNYMNFLQCPCVNPRLFFLIQVLCPLKNYSNQVCFRKHFCYNPSGLIR